jgi:hypothetical protein
MIFSFFKKLLKYYLDKLIHWLRMKKFNIQLDNDIKKYHKQLDKKVKKPQIKEVGKSGPSIEIPKKEVAPLGNTQN